MTDKSLSFEKRLKRLQSVVEQLEQGDLPLEKGVALYKEGLLLSSQCRTTLQKAKQDITIFEQGLVRDFDPAEVFAVAGDDGSAPGGEDGFMDDDTSREDRE